MGEIDGVALLCVFTELVHMMESLGTFRLLMMAGLRCVDWGAVADAVNGCLDEGHPIEIILDDVEKGNNPLQL